MKLLSAFTAIALIVIALFSFGKVFEEASRKDWIIPLMIVAAILVIIVYIIKVLLSRR